MARSINIQIEQTSVFTDNIRTIDASTARISVGSWPDFVTMNDKIYERTSASMEEEGDIQFVDYMHKFDTLRIFND